MHETASAEVVPLHSIIPDYMPNELRKHRVNSILNIGIGSFFIQLKSCSRSFFPLTNRIIMCRRQKIDQFLMHKCGHMCVLPTRAGKTFDYLSTLEDLRESAFVFSANLCLPAYPSKGSSGKCDWKSFVSRYGASSNIYIVTEGELHEPNTTVMDPILFVAIRPALSGCCSLHRISNHPGERRIFPAQLALLWFDYFDENGIDRWQNSLGI